MLDFMKSLLKDDTKKSSSKEKKEDPDALKSALVLIQGVLKGMGVNDAYTEIKGGYKFEKSLGSAGFYIIVKYNASLNINTLTFVAPILKLPNRKKEQFFLRCLQLNKFLVSCALAVVDDEVQIFSERDLKGLDAYEFKMMMQSVAISANDLDDPLSKEFGAEMIALGNKRPPKPDTIR